MPLIIAARFRKLFWRLIVVAGAVPVTLAWGAGGHDVSQSGYGADEVLSAHTSLPHSSSPVAVDLFNAGNVMGLAALLALGTLGYAVAAMQGGQR